MTANGSKVSAVAARARRERRFQRCERRRVGGLLVENSTAPWSNHLIQRSDETWLPEWSGNLGGVKRWRSSVARGVLGQAEIILKAVEN